MNSYQFSPFITTQLVPFKEYLEKLHYKTPTIQQYTNYARDFLRWLAKEHLAVLEVTYNDLLDFMDHCNREGNTKRHVNTKVRSIRKFYDCLKQKHPSLVNPAANLYLKGIGKKIPTGIIEFKMLKKFYQSFKTKDDRDKRNKAILGLLIYQGITTEELKALEIDHVWLDKGKIYIPGNYRRNSRVLSLKPFQVVELQSYLTETRPRIIKQIPLPRPTRKPKQINHQRIKTQLFISMNGSENLKNSLLHLFVGIRKTHPEITHAKQIRFSVITYWLKQYNLRQVQYMAGHKHVSSTERYKTDLMEGLHKKLEKLHPLNDASI